ncbi:alkaline phosphatase family protein [uncultured Methylobacterium sp.]|uniref:alkaline phosphatase family protein n=1 Tax=uncultured Methylobacterium sp. TaxID=157278 RepID=UPI0035CAC32C
MLLVGWDAADWQVIHPLLDAGRMPHLQRLVEGGTMGTLHSLQPMLSPILWTSIATGKRAYGHGVHGFIEPTPDRAGVRPVGTRTRTCKALWNILSQSGLRSVVCGWQASHPAEAVRGAAVSSRFALPPAGARPDDWPPAENAVQPPALAGELADLRLHPAEIEGAMIQALVPRAAELDQSDPAVQHRLNFLRERLAELLGTHAVATELLATQDWDFGAVYYECIDQVGHEFMPFHPPRLPEISETDFGWYRDVMTHLYLFHDQMLGRLVELAGPEARVLVVSDHGFESGARRPRGPVEPAQWHRAQGIFVLHGPGVQADARVEGATLLDIAPTVLALLGLPAGNDMEGRVLVSAFGDPPPAILPRIPSWERVPGEDGRPGPATGEEDPAAAQAALRQLAELGYIDPPGEDALRAVARAEAEADFNLAAAFIEGGRASEARLLLLRLTDRYPDETRYWRSLVAACFAAGVPTEAAPALAALERLEPGRAQTVVLRGLLAWARDDLAGCQAAWDEAERLAPDDPTTQTYLGRLYLRRRQWADAERAFGRALALDPESAEANYGLSVALPRQGRERVEPGIEYALRAVGLRHEFPEAHFQLGALLSRLGWYDRAVQAFEITLRLRPGFVVAHRYLARIYSHLGRPDAARRQKETVAHLLETRFPQPAVD